MWRNFVLSWLKYRADTCCKVISVLCWTTVWYVAYSKTCPKPEAWKPSKWRRRSSKQKSHLPFRAQLQIPPCRNSTRPTFLKVVFYKSIFGGFLRQYVYIYIAFIKDGLGNRGLSAHSSLLFWAAKGLIWGKYGLLLKVLSPHAIQRPYLFFIWILPWIHGQETPNSMTHPWFSYVSQTELSKSSGKSSCKQ